MISSKVISLYVKVNSVFHWIFEKILFASVIKFSTFSIFSNALCLCNYKMSRKCTTFCPQRYLQTLLNPFQLPPVSHTNPVIFSVCCDKKSMGKPCSKAYWLLVFLQAAATGNLRTKGVYLPPFTNELKFPPLVRNYKT